MPSAGSDRSGSAGSQGGASQAGAHLDADEMSAYAEGALPAAAHARYVSHLADCDSCRRIVTELMLTSEVAGEEGEHVAAQDVAPSKPWWSAIAALFAPSVLRYAVPALLLLGIIVVAFVATRERRGSTDLVALNEQQDDDDADVAPEEAAHAPSSQAPPEESMGANRAAATGNNANQSGAASSNTSSTDGMLARDANAPEPPPVTSTTTTQAPAGARQDSAEREENLNARLYDDQPKPAPAPPANASTAASETVAKEKAGEEQEQGRTQNNEPAQASRKETADLARSKDEDKSNPSVSGGSALGKAETSQAGSRAATRSRPAARRSETAAADNKADSGGAAETRSVNGRRFRRQGNAWVDTAYNSSRSTTHVARGSEQYRALVADEPALRTFAEQLNGEVIVVWKGKAYRIY